MTFELDSRATKCAQLLADNILSAKLSRGDMIAIEAKYHPPCLLELYHKTSRLEIQAWCSKSDSDFASTKFEIESLAEY